VTGSDSRRGDETDPSDPAPGCSPLDEGLARLDAFLEQGAPSEVPAPPPAAPPPAAPPPAAPSPPEHAARDTASQGDDESADPAS
jgi:hypothetical protein